MRVIIVGIGEIGLQLANLLARRGDNELVLIDRDPDRADEISNSLDALVLRGDGSNPEILEKAQVGEADALVAATGSDQINTVIALLGFSLVASGGLTLDVIVVPNDSAHKLVDLKMPRGVHPIAIRRAEDLLIPYPDLSLEAEDELIMMYDNEKAFEKVRRQITDQADDG